MRAAVAGRRTSSVLVLAADDYTVAREVPLRAFDLSGVRTYPLASRQSKANAADFATPYTPGRAWPAWSRRCPAILAAPDFKAVVDAIRRGARAAAAASSGASARTSCKTGLSPMLIDLMERGFVSALATNGAGVIHDFELALSGATSEDVDEALGPGRFGMAEETGRLLNARDQRGRRATGSGLGQAVVRRTCTRRRRRTRTSASPPRPRGCGIPLTVHVAIGTDIIHMHPDASGAAHRRGQPARFPLLRVERRAARRGVYLNCGSAVVLPEVFLKAVALARNQGTSLDGLTTVNLDFMRHLPPADQRGLPPGGRHRQGLFAGRASRDHDSAARGRAHRWMTRAEAEVRRSTLRSDPYSSPTPGLDPRVIINSSRRCSSVG